LAFRICFRTNATSEILLQLVQPHAGNEQLVQTCSLPICCVILIGQWTGVVGDEIH